MNNINTPCITFDQPLYRYIKAIDISKNGHEHCHPSCWVSHRNEFLRCCWSFDEGSGIEEVLGLVFSASTVEHVLSGKAHDI